MKKLLLFFCVLTIITAKGFAQNCTPDPNASGLYYPTQPDSTTNVWQDYEQTVTFNVPTDTTIQIITIHIDSLHLNTVIGLPNGLTYGCNSTLGNCNYPGGTEGCFIISGNVNDTVGVYPIIFDVTVYGLIDTVSAPLNQQVEVYNLYVGEPLSVQALDLTKFDVLQNTPNPFNGSTTIKFNSPVAETVNFSVYDMIGRQVHTTKIDAVTGVNTINYTSEKLAPGAYFYTLANGKNSITKRMVLTGK